MATEPRDFYVTRGTLRRDAPSYVTRRADEDFYDGLSRGEFCYVLTSRQMGKSSLMGRTAGRLRAEGVSVVTLDLTGLGQNLTAEQWYLGLLGGVGEQLDLEDELDDFWENHSKIGPLQRWMRAIRDVVMKRKQGRVVLFVDEIDTVRSLPFSTDEFFAGIREFYNRRTEDRELERLTFGLLGVAAPSDLIRDTRTTPFNIGRRIELTDFNDAEAVPLAGGFSLKENVASRVLQRVLYWTEGHPYLTQSLCKAVSEDGAVMDEKGVDRVCESLFISAGAREKDDNLIFVRERLLRSEEADHAALLDLYARIHRGRPVRDDETNPLITVLRLSGITRAHDGRVHVRNKIYARVFDRNWILSNMPDSELRRQRAAYRRGLFRAASVAAVVLLLMVGLASAALYQRRAAIEERRLALVQKTRADQKAEEANQNSRELQRTLDQLKDALKLAEERKEMEERATKRASAEALNARAAQRESARNALQAQQQRQAAEHALIRLQRSEQEAQRDFKAAQESERRLRKISIEGNNRVSFMASQLAQIAPAKASDYWHIQRGVAQMFLHNYETAIDDYSKALEINPDNITVFVGRSYLYNVTKQPQRAINDAETGLKANPRSFIASLNRGIGLSLLGRYEEARPALEDAIKNFMPTGAGDYPQSYVADKIQDATGRKIISANADTALTSFYYELANIEAARGGEEFENALRRADTQAPNTNAYLFALNWALMNYEQRDQDFGILAAEGALWERACFNDQALTAYRDFQARMAKEPSVKRYSTLAAWVERRIDALKANVPCKAIESQAEREAEDAYLDGYESTSSGKTNTLKFWAHAIQTNPGNIGYLLERAQFHYFRNEFIGARLDCDAVIKANPNIAAAYLYRALANANESSPSGVLIIDDIRKAKALDPTTVPTSLDPNLGKVSSTIAQVDIDEALDLLARIAKYGFPSYTPYFQMAKLLNDQKRYREGLEKIKLAISVNADIPALYDERLRSEEGLCTQRDEKTNVCLYRKELVRRQARGYRNIGDSLVRRGQIGIGLDLYSNSLRLLDKLGPEGSSTEIQHDISDTLSTIGNIIEEQGGRNRAIEYLQVEFGAMDNLKNGLSKEVEWLSRAQRF